MGNAQRQVRKDGYTWSLMDDSVIERMMERRDRQERRRGVPARLQAGERAQGDPGRARQWEHRSVRGRLGGGAGRQDGRSNPAMLQGDGGRVQRLLCRPATTSCSPRTASTSARSSGPRYYAVKGRTVFLGTMGGIKVNEKMEVLDKKDAVIPGLYAGGFDAGGMYGDSYPIKSSSGLASAFAFNSGRIAGRSILKYLGM